MRATAVMWFRRDLRLTDNPALVEAVRAARPDGEVVPFFCRDARLEGPAGDNRLAFMYGCLEALDRSLGGRSWCGPGHRPPRCPHSPSRSAPRRCASPIVDHAEERAESLRRYEAIRA